MFMVSALCAVHVGRFSLASSHAEMSARPALGQKGLS